MNIIVNKKHDSKTLYLWIVDVFFNNFLMYRTISPYSSLCYFESKVKTKNLKRKKETNLYTGNELQSHGIKGEKSHPKPGK